MDNYYNTANRMYKSSQTLHNNKEFHNSCYLGGYIIECYAKNIIGVSYGFKIAELKDFGHDLKKMNKEFQYIFSHSSVSSYMLDMPMNFSTCLSGNKRWDPYKRYSDTINEWNEMNSNNYQNEIALAMQKMAQMILDGHNLI